jgi:hypothetical protein
MRKRAGNVEFPPYCLPVEVVIAIGYPRPAPSLTASDPAFFVEIKPSTRKIVPPPLLFVENPA